MTDTRHPRSGPQRRSQGAQVSTEAQAVPGEQVPARRKDRTDEVSPERPDAKSKCNLDGCPEEPEWRGLCSAHRQTHRGLAGPKEKGAPRERTGR